MTTLRRILTLAVFVGLMVLGWEFAGSNSGPITVNYLVGEFTGIALWLVLLVSFGLGAACVLVFAAFSRVQAGLVARRYRKTVASLESEVHQLRNLPLNPESPALIEPAEEAAQSTETASGSA